MIEGLVTQKEIERLKKFAALSRSVAEIGSYKGKSAIAMASVCSGPVHCIDLWDNHPTQKRYQTARQTFDRNVKASGLSNINPIQGLSGEVVKTWDREIDLLFIDGCHKYDYVKSDFELWSPFVRKWIAFHDYNPKARSGKDVFRFINELMKATAEWRKVEITEKLYIIERVKGSDTQ
jgi:hypothetical protein